MDNPYEARMTQPQAKDSLRDLWRRQLNCPHCGQPGVSAGVAFLAHPFLRVRCRPCQGHSIVRLTGAARKRAVALAWAATITIAAAIAFTGLTDTFFVYDLIGKWTPEFWNFVFSKYGLENQMKIVIAAIILISVTPLLAILLVSAQFSLRDVAYYSTLICAGQQHSE